MTHRPPNKLDVRRVSRELEASFWHVLQRDGFWRNLLTDRAADIAVIDQIGRSDEPGFLPQLAAGCAWHPHRQLRAAARLAVDRLVSIVPPELLGTLDIFMREAMDRWELSNSTWSGLRSSDLGDLQGADAFGLLALASMHGDGRIREAALIKLGAISTGEELPYLLLRLNDWALPVRERARQLVLAKLRPECVPALVRCIPLIQQLGKRMRAKHGWLMRALEALLLENNEALRAACQSEDRETRRLCLQIAIRASVPWLDSILRATIREPDPILRLLAVKELLSRANDLPALTGELLRDGFMPIRRETLQALADAKAGNFQAILTDALLDRHGSIREMARYRLRGVVDAAEHYRVAFGSLRGSRLAIAIRGLAECCSDATAIAPFLEAKEVCVRRAAISAVGRHDGQQFEEALFAALADPSNGVSKEATMALARRAQSLSAARIHALLHHPSPVVRKNSLRLATRLPKWTQLRCILAACRDSHSQIAARASGAVRLWLDRYNSSFVIPTTKQVKDAAEELEQSSERVPSACLIELKALLSGVRP